MIYHITQLKDWQTALATGEYHPESLGVEGFIHCSTNIQVLPVAEKYYKGKRRMLLLMIDPARLSSELKWEPPSGGTPAGVSEGELFPHIYGPINLESVIKVFDLESNPDGKYKVLSLD